MFLHDSIRFYIYLDKKGIDSIYTQTPNAATNYTETILQHIDGEIKANLEISSPFKALGSVSGEAIAGAQRQITQEQEIIITYEEKVKYIEKKISQDHCGFIFDIIKAKPHLTNYLIVCKGLFRLTAAIDDNTNSRISISDIQHNFYSYTNLSFNFCSTPTLHYISDKTDLLNDEVNNGVYYVDMYFSGSNLVRNVRHITNQLKFGKDFMFTVLGELSREGGNIYTLKPYAIWRQTDTNI